MSNQLQPPYHFDMAAVFPPIKMPQLFPTDYFSGLTKPMTDSIALNFASHLPDVRQTILDSYKAVAPDWSKLVPNVSQVLGVNFSGELAKSFAPSIQTLQKSILAAFPPVTGLGPAIVAPGEAGTAAPRLPSADELLRLGTAVAASHATDPEFLETAREAVNALDGAEPAIEAYVASLSGYATNALELISQGIYAFVFTVWVLAVLGVSISLPEAGNLIGTTGLVAPAVATAAQRRWDGFVDSV